MKRYLSLCLAVCLLFTACSKISSIVRVKSGERPHVVLLEPSVPRFGTDAKTIVGDSAVIDVDCTYRKSQVIKDYSQPCPSNQMRALRFIYGWQ